MNSLLLILAAVAVAAPAGYLVGRRRRRGPGAAGGVTERVFPDPALKWLARQHGASGVWVLDTANNPGGGMARHMENGLAPGQAREVELRVQRLTGRDGGGVERLDRGTLVYQARSGTVAAMLIPAGSPGGMDRAQAELGELVQVLTDRPLLLATRETQVPVETLPSVCLQLAHQLERIADAGVLVAIRFSSGTIRVMAISPLGDRRLRGQLVVEGSPVALVATGQDDNLHTARHPIGLTHPDRRKVRPVQVLRIGPQSEPMGAVVLSHAREEQLTGVGLSHVLEAIRDAEPAIRNARMYFELRETAFTDPLTGLKNRRGVEEAMTRVGSEEGALIYADLDHFKRLNDQLGHPAGDAALRHFASVITNSVRVSATVGRIGGEEFCIWLPGASLAEGAQVADRIKRTLETDLWIWETTPHKISASFGVAACPETSATRHNLMGQADAALYRAKEGGRNQVAVAEKE
ncbi:MAG: GGDEF domain-containing protein [Gemmatimonadales bacterium]